ncbi:uncharacterized protein BO72DRAFT_505167 [Aspergillus fijiensis CBS 313.89]|uniref:Protein kinase domain-containing protein n=1 Tax=Aspergillus fijiensis CBS 313.89 TaxID=1448319 RepID=A0A8G1VVI5_9EURO|nr:uncharacterized protein BO72DRAFT_505167 [Aspergillus fijiensis CBS 313.89]RAK70999.1 hypothetical protein BO72DRAFT_505167 [Aspergillus fijiensis CBS 313.89]
MGRNDLIEEQTLPYYHQKRYYPVRIGDTFKDQYRIIAKLGYGAYSPVWPAWDEGFLGTKPQHWPFIGPHQKAGSHATISLGIRCPVTQLTQLLHRPPLHPPTSAAEKLDVIMARGLRSSALLGIWAVALAAWGINTTAFSSGVNKKPIFGFWARRSESLPGLHTADAAECA